MASSFAPMNEIERPQTHPHVEQRLVLSVREHLVHGGDLEHRGGTTPLNRELMGDFVRAWDGGAGDPDFTADEAADLKSTPDGPGDHHPGDRAQHQGDPDGSACPDLQRTPQMVAYSPNMADIEHSEVRAYSTSAPTCAACGAPLVDVVRDDSGRIMSKVPK